MKIDNEVLLPSGAVVSDLLATSKRASSDSMQWTVIDKKDKDATGASRGDRVRWARRWLLFAAVALAVLTAGRARAGFIPVTVLGMKVGELNVSKYTAEKSGDDAQAYIVADFSKAGIAACGEEVLKANAKLGMTYMQVVTINTDKPQGFILSGVYNGKGPVPLVGTFSDPPIHGVTFFDGTTKTPKGQKDDTPWYSVATGEKNPGTSPTGIPGDLPPTLARYTEPPPPNGDGKKHQYRDRPNLDFGSATDKDLAYYLNGKNGSIIWETALVGVQTIPKNLLTGTYEVVPLLSFTWGIDFTYIGPKGKTTGFTAADYKVTKIPLKSSASVSDAFRGAFDQQGNNKDFEWKVNFLEPVKPMNSCPEPSSIILFATGALGLLCAARRRAGSTLGRRKSI